MRTIEELIAATRLEAIREPFPVDAAVYEKAGKDPGVPVLFAGSLAAEICVFGRDLGKDEVAHGEPLIGAGGKLVREGLLKAFETGPRSPSDRWLRDALKFALLSNTVPYKPPGNKAYSEPVKARFRPFVAELLAGHWKGDRILTLGTEAFQWFARYAKPGAAEELWAQGDDRYSNDLEATIETGEGKGHIRKKVTISPLPHPSPLNARWYGRFPELLAERLRVRK